MASTWRLQGLGGVLLVSLLCGCADEHGPARPGGGAGGGGGGGADASPPGDGGGAQLVLLGRVCGLTDLQQPTACATADYSDFSIAFAGETIAPMADGSFELTVAENTTAGFAVITPPSGFRVSHAAIDPAALAASPSLRASLPVAKTVDFDDVMAVTGTNLLPGSGAVVVYIRDGDTPLAGSSVDAPAGTPHPTLYDQGGALSWSTLQTGARGTALLVGVPAAESLSLVATTPLDERTYAGLPVVAGAVTFAAPSYF